jgi:hypothetical protein
VIAIAIPISLLTYWPALDVGLLSDDFVLTRRALVGDLWPADWEYVRPFPLLLWRTMLDAIAPGWQATILHTVPVVLHGLNGWLVTHLAGAWGLARRDALTAGALFLVFPSNVEAVTWVAGTFDVLLTLCTLIAVRVWTGGADLSSRTGVVVLVALGLGLATKETAVVLPAMCAVAGAEGWRVIFDRRRAGLLLLGVLVVTIYALWRLAHGVPADMATLPDGYRLKELVSRPFASLVLPFHIGIPNVGLLIAASAVVWPVLVAHWTRAAHTPDRWRLALRVALWVLCAVWPVFTRFFVSPQLEGTRYLYLATAGWTVLLASALSSWNRVAQVVLLLGCAVLVRTHLGFWTDAATVRDRVLAAAQALPCRPERVEALPDVLAGAQVFRNGFADAVSAVVPEGPPCDVRWTGAAFERVSDLAPVAGATPPSDQSR